MKEKIKSLINFGIAWYRKQPPLRPNSASLKFWTVDTIIDTWLASFPLWLWAVIVILGAGAGLGAFLGVVHFSTGSKYWCSTCHFDVEDKNPWHIARVLNAYSCTHCHARPFLNGARGAVEHNVKKFWGIAQAVSQPELYPAAASPIPEVNETKCLSCHQDVWTLTPQLDRYYTERLAAIGLPNTHEKHYRWREFTKENEARLQALTRKQGRSPDQDLELWTLEKIQKENCAQCHSRTKRDAAGQVYIDKGVNMASRDPLGCGSCHLEVAAHLEDPATQAAYIPTEATCRRCHTGDLHGYKKLSLADQKRGVLKDCLTCHPQYMQDQAATAAPQTGREYGPK